MEPAHKKAKITGHFRVALKPQDVNVQSSNHKKSLALVQQIANKQHDPIPNKQKTSENNHVKCKENIELITIADEEPEDQECGRCSIETQEQQQQQPHLQDLQHQNKPPLLISLLQNNYPHKQPSVAGHLLRPPKTVNKYVPPEGIKPNIQDHDESLIPQSICEAHYAWESFQYDRQREIQFRNIKYIDDENLDHIITPKIRTELVDWLVYLQNQYALNHEALYSAVKICDQYLMRKVIRKQNLPLLYMTAIFIASKFDERLPPIYIMDLIDASRCQFRVKYTKKQVVLFEVDILTTLDFNLGFPLSYGFLRRFARCTQSDRTTLTLARYILESSLLDYEMIDVLESKQAATALLLALEMLEKGHCWNETAEFYTGYKQEELYPTLLKMNNIISQSSSHRHVYFKYSDGVFLNVASIRPLPKC